MEESNNILINIKEINETSFILRQLPLPIEEIQFGKNLSFGLGLGFKINLDIEELRLSFSITYKVDKFENHVVELTSEIVFEIKDLAKVASSEKDGQYQINDDFLVTLVGISIGTTRGMLAANTKGSPLAKFPLPILNPKELLEQMNKQSGEK